MSLMSKALTLTPKHLAKQPIFQGWTSGQLATLLAASESIYLEAGQCLFKRGEPSRYFYVLDKGEVQLQLSPSPTKVKKIRVLQTGDSVGDAYVLMGKPYRVDAVALNAVRALKIDQNTFFTCLAQQPSLLVGFIAQLSERLYGLLGDALTAHLLSGTQRVIYYLLQDISLENGERITLAKSKAQVAAELNLTPEHFSRILHDLSARQFIRVDGRHISFLDVDGLCVYDR